MLNLNMTILVFILKSFYIHFHFKYYYLLIVEWCEQVRGTNLYLDACKDGHEG